MDILKEVVADSKGRILLGAKHAGERYFITQDSKGRFILERAVLVPEREAWLHRNQKAKASVLKGLMEAKQKRIKKF